MKQQEHQLEAEAINFLTLFATKYFEEHGFVVPTNIKVKHTSARKVLTKLQLVYENLTQKKTISLITVTKHSVISLYHVCALQVAVINFI